MISGTIDKLEKYHTDIINLVNSFRKTKTDFKSYIKEVPSNTIYCLLIKKHHLVGMFRYYKATSKFIKEWKLPSKYHNYYQVASVIVDDKYRGKGYGKQLMKYAVKTNKMILDTYLSWVPAVRLYLGTGFKIIQTKKEHDDYLVLFASN